MRVFHPRIPTSASVAALAGEIIAEAVDGSNRHPLDHAAMVAVELVADRDRRLWPYNGFAHLGRHADTPDDGGYIATPTLHTVSSGLQAGPENTAALQPPQQCQQQQEQQQSLFLQQGQQQEQQQVSVPPCKKHKADAGAAAQQPCCEGTNCSSALDATTTPNHSQATKAARDAATAATDGSGDAIAHGAAAAAVAADGSADWSNKPYLCTGYDCFVAREPCIMCSMAMVHSRLARVVYCAADTQHGALGGKLRLHAQRSLNHHYLVYHMPQKA
jgi:tRNA-specific adenosine deaminase 3